MQSGSQNAQYNKSEQSPIDGILKKYVTGITGSAGSGKSVLGMQIMLMHVLPVCCGGGAGRVCVLSSRDFPHISRLQQVIQAHTLSTLEIQNIEQEYNTSRNIQNTELHTSISNIPFHCVCLGQKTTLVGLDHLCAKFWLYKHGTTQLQEIREYQATSKEYGSAQYVDAFISSQYIQVYKVHSSEDILKALSLLPVLRNAHNTPLHGVIIDDLTTCMYSEENVSQYDQQHTQFHSLIPLLTQQNQTCVIVWNTSDVFETNGYFRDRMQHQDCRDILHQSCIFDDISTSSLFKQTCPNPTYPLAWKNEGRLVKESGTMAFGYYVDTLIICTRDIRGNSYNPKRTLLLAKGYAPAASHAIIEEGGFRLEGFEE